jgi:hypothetical protein
MLFPCYTVTNRDVNFRFPDRVTQTEFCHGWPLVISGTGGKFAAGVADTGGNLPLVFVDTGGKFATNINNTSGTGGKICRQCR